MSKYYSTNVAFGANSVKTEQITVSASKIGTVTTEASSGALIVDDVPKLNSLNPVSSDGVARAVIQAGAEIPTYGESNEGQVLTVNADASAVEWANIPSDLPDMTGQDGKVLGAVDNSGTMTAQWISPPEELPTVTGNANKVLTVNSGATGVEWADVPTELPASLGTAGQVLTVNSGATGVEWATPSGGGGGDVVVIPLAAAPTSSDLETLFNQVDAAVTANKQVVIKTTNSGNKVRHFALTNTNNMNANAKFYHFNCIEMVENLPDIDAIDHWMVVSYTNFGSDPQYNFTVSDYTIASGMSGNSFDPFSA